MMAMYRNTLKHAMIMSDAELETKPVPSGEATKDDLSVNSHPATPQGGAPVLDGNLTHTERPNVNAMREAIETQSEMEVGKPIGETQAEVKDKAVTVEKGSGTQIIINIAGKQKTMDFSNRATADAFIKGASAKFGSKFKLVAAPEEPVTSGMSDIDAAAPSFKAADATDEFEFKREREPDERYLPQTPTSSRTYAIMVGDQFVMVAPDETYRLVPEEAKATRFDGEFGSEDAKQIAAEIKESPMSGGNPVRVVPASKTAKTKTAATYQVVKEGNSWWIKGLPSATWDGEESKPDSFIIPGMNHSMNTPESIAAGIYESLYDELQINDHLQDGDIFNTQIGQFICQGIHVVPYDQKAKDALRAATSARGKEANVKQPSSQELSRQMAKCTCPESCNIHPNEKKASNMNLSPGGVPSQVLENFYPELQHELVSYPNANNTPMVNPDISGDPHSTPDYEEGMLPGAIEDVFSTMSRIGYVSTSPAGGMGIGRDGKSQVLEGAPLRKENDIRGPMFTEEFYANTDAVPGAALSLAASKKAGADEKTQFSLFLKRVMGEVVASFLAAFKATSRTPFNKVPGVGEIQLAQVEQSVVSSFNLVNTGSRVKYLLDKLTDSEIQDCINDGFAQGAIWHENKEGGFVYECFARAETIDTESMLMKYKFIIGTKDAE